MTRRSIKHEKPSEEDVEEVMMPSSMRPKRKSRAEPTEDDTDMVDAPTVSTSSFPAMPTPSSFAEESTVDTPINVQTQRSMPSSRYHRSAAPSAETGLQLVGHRVQVLVDAIQDFREFGIDHVVQLPELVLVGDQSAGKSSLMGALAEIHLPQSAGCCTRCPAHIKTTPAEVWTCKISLEQEYSYEPVNGRPIESKDVTKNRRFPPWKQQDLEVKPFITIRNKSQLEEALRWAQIATLNHNKHHSQYVPWTDSFIGDESTEAKFSPNVVAIEISGPGLTPLSFYDLPGIFQNAGQKEDQYLVKVIENLAIKYIERPHALIICALPMSADAATSRTSKVIADCHAADRCIGVLTKADQLQEGQYHTEFQNILEGRTYQLGHGYFVTKLPGQSRSLYDENYHSNARVAEEHFFSTQNPWNSEWSEFRTRFGTSNLAQALSQKFAEQIIDSIPHIENKIKNRTSEIEVQLEKLPELPKEHILHVVLPDLSKFGTSMQNLLDGGTSGNDFQSKWAMLCEQFRDTILKMEPKIIITDPSDSVLPDVINIDDDDDDISMSDGLASGRKRMNDETPTPSEKKPRHDESASSSLSAQNSGTNGSSNTFPIPQYDGGTGAPRMSGENGLAHRFGSPNVKGSPVTKTPIVEKNEAPNPFAGFLKAGKNSYKIGEIRNQIHKHRKMGVPATVNDQVRSEMCMQSVTPWDGPLDLMVDITLEMLQNHSEAILRDILTNWKQTQLFKQSLQHLKTLFNEFAEFYRAEADALYELETYKLFTVNSLAWEVYSQEQGEILQRARKAARAKAYVSRELAMRRRPQFRDEAARRKAIAEVKDEQLGKDPFEKEIEVATYVRGYYKTAALRFVDSVCLSIHGKLFRGAKKRIFYYLEGKLGLNTENGEQRCRELTEENAVIAEKRAKLKKEKDSVYKFAQRLHQLVQDNAAIDAADAEAAVM